MNYLTDPDFDKKMIAVYDLLREQQDILLALIYEGPDENSPSQIDEIRVITDKTRT